MRKLFADNQGKEITVNTKSMGTFSSVKDDKAGPDDLYPFKICYQPSSNIE